MRIFSPLVTALCCSLFMIACGGGDDRVVQPPDTGPTCVPSDEICDGLDNNCDGEIDEGFDLGTTCDVGEGACAAEGRIACNEDGESSCDVVAADPSDEVCDGLDNNCDGEIDEGFDVGGACSEGVGACEVDGQISCLLDGTVVCAARPGAPEAELCDGIDNDCDGETDEDFSLGEACLSGVGACETAGVNACADDGSAFCNGPAITGSDESCDGVDNNCDGEIDEGFAIGEACSAGVGACESAGAIACQDDGSASCNAVPGEASEEVCDWVDNNCDGETDEGLNVGDACSSGLGACQAEGQQVCTMNGGTLCNATPGEPSDETCDGLDNNCNGVTDDDFNVGNECSAGVGACSADGEIACLEDGTASCNAEAGRPSAEICDDADNDCDGETDEGFNVGGLCNAQAGNCETVGALTCADDGSVACEGPALYSTCSIQRGQCSGSGRLYCIDEAISCYNSTPLLRPEACDGTDTDCDGIVDEGCQEGPLAIQLRVTRGTSRGNGILQAAVAGRAFGYVCDDNFDDNNNAARVACRQMGYDGGTHDNANTGTNIFALDNVQCASGDLANLTLCQSTGRENCSASEGVLLNCDGGARLVQSDGDNSRTGSLQVYADGTWGTVCDDYFDRNLRGADVACREMGYAGALRQFDRNTGGVAYKLDDVVCEGAEHDLLDCTHRAINSHNCGASEGVGIECLAAGACRNNEHCPANRRCLNEVCR